MFLLVVLYESQHLRLAGGQVFLHDHSDTVNYYGIQGFVSAICEILTNSGENIWFEETRLRNVVG